MFSFLQYFTSQIVIDFYPVPFYCPFPINVVIALSFRILFTVHFQNHKVNIQIWIKNWGYIQYFHQWVVGLQWMVFKQYRESDRTLVGKEWNSVNYAWRNRGRLVSIARQKITQTMFKYLGVLVKFIKTSRAKFCHHCESELRRDDVSGNNANYADIFFSTIIISDYILMMKSWHILRHIKY